MKKVYLVSALIALVLPLVGCDTEEKVQNREATKACIDLGGVPIQAVLSYTLKDCIFPSED